MMSSIFSPVSLQYLDKLNLEVLEFLLFNEFYIL